MILAESTSPYGSMEAFVEDDGRTVYLYLRATGEDGPEIRPVWVANRVAAPETEDVEAMREGLAPLMPRDGTRRPQGGPFFPGEELSLVWLEEGDGVALLHAGRPIAVVPPWAGMGGPPGYAADAAGAHDLAWELEPALEALGPRIAAAREYWEWRWSDASWSKIQEGGLAHLEARLGQQRRYWAADGGSFPPRAVVLFEPERPGGVSVYCTVGMGAQAMPQVEMYDAPPRIELALAARRASDRWPRMLSSLMAFPWQRLTWLGDGHTTQWSDPEAGIDALLLLRSPPPAKTRGGLFGLGSRPLPAPDLSGLAVRGAPVEYLWVLPITAAERELARSEGSAALARTMEREGRGWIREDG